MFSGFSVRLQSITYSNRRSWNNSARFGNKFRTKSVPLCQHFSNFTPHEAPLERFSDIRASPPPARPDLTLSAAVHMSAGNDALWAGSSWLVPRFCNAFEPGVRSAIR